MCSGIRPMGTRTKIVILMHPMEYRHEKSATGRLTHICLADSEIQVGLGFDLHPAVQALIHDPGYYPVLLYPGPGAINLTDSGVPRELSGLNAPGGRRLLVFLLDATWACAKKMFRQSPSLQALPRLMFRSSHKSRYVIKRQPADFCLSTLEATHELLLALEQAGIESYPDKTQLIDIFMRMQDFQISCAQKPELKHYERSKNRPMKDYEALKRERGI
jgi:DTW domain-containing protein YfiP